MKNLQFKIIFVIISFVIFFALAQGAEGATYYVRADATGLNNGTDWTNAYTSLPAALTRGHTYYIADGAYGSYTFDDTTAGTTLITIKKATVADHGTDTGWNSSYGDGQAVWTYWDISMSYLTIDGQTGGGPRSWDSGHGFAVRNLREHLVIFTSKTSNVTIRHVEIDGTSNAPANHDAVYTISGFSNLVMQYMYIHDIGCDTFQIYGNITNFLLEYSKMARNRSDPSCHGDGFEFGSGLGTGWVHRYNLFEDTYGTYLWGAHDGGTLDGAQIYGNVIYRKNEGYFTNGIVSALSHGGTVQNIKFYNNTIAGFTFNVAGFNYMGTGNVAYNNLWYLNGASLSFGGITHDYNWFYGTSQSETHIQKGTGNPFVDLGGGNLTLNVPTQAGISRGSYYTEDMNGTQFGLDGNWDRGAFEFGIVGVRPSAPFNLSIN